MIPLTTIFVKDGLRPRITLVWPDGVRRRPTVRRASGRAGGRVGSRHGRAAEAGGCWPSFGGRFLEKSDEPGQLLVVWRCLLTHTLQRRLMARHDGLSQWTDCVSSNMPHLTKPQATVLALWSFGMACTRSCGRTTVATFLALLLREPLANLEQRLYEWCLDAKDKAGNKRTSLDVTTCFVPLLGWIIRLWTSEQIALTLDASSLGDRFVVLAVCVVYRGCGIPVAWTILPAGKKRAWRREWLRMLRLLRPAIPRAWTVLVLADRGLYARWLFRRIGRVGWR